MLKSITYASGEPGPKLLVLGAVHGNEKCGTAGIERVIGEIDAGKYAVTSGQVTFIPVCNPRAYAQDVRFTERNLNRYLVPMANPNCYEAEIGNILCAAISSCDVLLDIHSYTVGGEPFALVGPHNAREYAFAAALGDYAVVTGWDEAYAKTGRNKALGKGQDVSADIDEGVGTTNYARRCNAISVTVECGQHKDPNAPGIAYQTIRNALRFLGMTGEETGSATRQMPRLVQMKQVVYRDDAGTFTKPWKNLHAVAKGEAIAHRADGTPVTASEDSLIIMPKSNADMGEEWFYLGVEAGDKSAA